MKYTDIIICFIVIVMIIVIIVINVNNTIDKKLNNVEINIPPPQITVKLQKSCYSDEYTSVLIDDNSKKISSQNNTLLPIAQMNKNDTSEHFDTSAIIPSIVTSELNLSQYSITDAINNISKKVDNLSNNLSNTVQNITKQIQDDIKNSKNITTEEYQLNKSGNELITSENLNSTTLPKTKKNILEETSNNKCNNKSLNDAQKNAYQYMAKNMNNVKSVNFPSCEKYERDFIGENLDQLYQNQQECQLNQLNDPDEDITQFYRENQTFVKSYLEDPILRGSNLTNYDNYSPLFTSGKIPLDKDIINPKPSGYIFPNSPIFDK